MAAGQLYSSSTTIGIGINVYTDINLTNVAIDGVYSDGNTCWIVSGGAGLVTSTATCGGYSSNAYLGQVYSDICSLTYPEIVYWSGTYGLGTYVYLDSGLTIPVPSYYTRIQIDAYSSIRYLANTIVGGTSTESC